MLKWTKTKANSVADLIRQWERVGNGDHLIHAAMNTAVYLSRLNDVPSGVLKALDEVTNGCWERQGTAVFIIVSYLRSLRVVEKVMR